MRIFRDHIVLSPIAVWKLSIVKKTWDIQDIYKEVHLEPIWFFLRPSLHLVTCIKWIPAKTGYNFPQFVVYLLSANILLGPLGVITKYNVWIYGFNQKCFTTCLILLRILSLEHSTDRLSARWSNIKTFPDDYFLTGFYFSHGCPYLKLSEKQVEQTARLAASVDFLCPSKRV